MTNEQILASVLADIEDALDANESENDPFLDNLWNMIHKPEVWNVVLSILQPKVQS